MSKPFAPSFLDDLAKADPFGVLIEQDVGVCGATLEGLAERAERLDLRRIACKTLLGEDFGGCK